MDHPRIFFIDWMKDLGMFLIVYGHVAGDSIAHVTHPYRKQLGVAFFISSWDGESLESLGSVPGRLDGLFPVPPGSRLCNHAQWRRLRDVSAT